MHTAAVLAAVVAGLYALVLVLLLIVSVGDGNHVLNLSGWFSWHVVYVMILVSDISVYVPTLQAQQWHSFARQAMSLVAAAQAIGFAVWAIVEWTRASEQNYDRLAFAPRNFYGMAAATLVVMAAMALVVFYSMLNQPPIHVSQWERRSRKQ